MSFLRSEEISWSGYSVRYVSSSLPSQSTEDASLLQPSITEAGFTAQAFQCRDPCCSPWRIGQEGGHQINKGYKQLFPRLDSALLQQAYKGHHCSPLRVLLKKRAALISARGSTGIPPVEAAAQMWTSHCQSQAHCMGKLQAPCVHTVPLPGALH